MDKFTCVEDIGDLRQAVAEALEIKRDRFQFSQQDTACSQRSSRKDEFQTNIHKRFPSFVVKILRPGRPENCRPKTPR